MLHVYLRKLSVIITIINKIISLTKIIWNFFTFPVQLFQCVSYDYFYINLSPCWTLKLDIFIYRFQFLNIAIAKLVRYLHENGRICLLWTCDCSAIEWGISIYLSVYEVELNAGPDNIWPHRNLPSHCTLIHFKEFPTMTAILLYKVYTFAHVFWPFHTHICLLTKPV